MSNANSKITSELVDGAIARVMLNSPKNGNAQDVSMLYEFDEALMAAAHDEKVRVIIVGGHGRHFSAGHDLKSSDFSSVGVSRPLKSTWGDVNPGTIEGWYGWEREMYFDMCMRWRAIAKPTIAQVQGACIAGGLMIAWACDLIVAADNVYFQDPVVNLGMPGVEFFAHLWEIGSRRAKEKLFTGDPWTARDALEWGMVNRIVAADKLSDETLALAKKVAGKPSVGLKFAKEALNSSMDTQGFTAALKQAFAIHHLCHAHNRLKYGTLIDPAGLPESVRRSLPGGKLPKLESITVKVD